MTSHLDPRLSQIARLFDHLLWANLELGNALRFPSVPGNAIREYAHIVGAEELWLSRIEQRQPVTPIWPELGIPDTVRLAREIAAQYANVLGGLNDAALNTPVTYTNSAAQTFATPVGDILIHVAMHGQYHRGKVNLMLRQGNLAPAPVDFIAFVRGVPAAVTQPTSSESR